MSAISSIYYTPPIQNAHIADILKEIYMDKIYDPYLVGRKDLTLVDWGSNVGLWSQYASQFGNVYSFEPSKQHMESQIRMVTENGLSERIKMHHVAISNEDGETTLYHSDNVTSHSLDPILNTTGTSEKVQAWTVKTMFEKCKLDKVDFLKLDVEGWEHKILCSKEFVEYAPKIHTIVGEWHQWTQTDPRQFINMLRDYGYDADWTNKSQASTFYATRK